MSTYGFENPASFSSSGKLTLCIPPSIHAAIATAAETSGKSPNKTRNYCI